MTPDPLQPVAAGHQDQDGVPPEAAPGVRATSRPPRPSSNAGGVGRDIELGRKGGRVAGHADTMYGSQDTVDPIIRASAALFAVVIDAGLRE
jgi:hypothetical protein